MSGTRIGAAFAFLAVIAGTFALSHPDDLGILRRVSRVTVESVKDGLPETAKMAGPLAAFRAGDALPVEERVRVRIRTDKDMLGSEVNVVSMPSAGQVKLKGLVQSSSQRNRAIELAERTAGVESVIEELAMPVGP